MWSFSFKEEETQQPWLLISLATLTATIFLLLRRRRRWSPELPPGPKGVPVAGYLPFLGTELHEEFERLSRVYGAVFKVWLGHKLCVVVSSPEMVREVVRTQDVNFSDRDTTVATFVGSHAGNDIAFASYGPQWKNLRKVFVREMMSNNILDSLYGIRREEIHKSIKRVYQSVDSSPVNLGNLSFETATNSVLSMVCGAAMQGNNDSVNVAKLRAVVADLMVLFAKPNVSDMFPILAPFDFQGIERDTKKVVEEISKVLDSAVQRQRELNAQCSDGQGVKRMDFLQSLLELHDGKSSITMAQLKAILQDTIVGATDTTTTMVEWTLAELLKHPKEMSKVQEELTRVVGLDSMVEESHLSQLTYLNAAIKEAHRLHPALPFLVPRRPVSTTTLGGYTIPKDTKIFLNVYAIHRDPRYWENPLEFNPERFLGKFDYLGNDFRFLPFGSGRRICAGILLGERMLSYTIASFLHCFEWKLPGPLDELDMSSKFGIVVKKAEPLVAIPTSRLSNLNLYS